MKKSNKDKGKYFDDIEDSKIAASWADVTAVVRASWCLVGDHKLTNDVLADMIAKWIEACLKDATPTKVKKLNPTKRGADTCSISVEQMQDELIYRVFNVITKHTEQVRFTSQFQFQKQQDRDFHPVFLNILLNVDMLIKDPNKPGMNDCKT